MNNLIHHLCRAVLTAAIIIAGMNSASAQGTYKDTGISDTQIKLGASYPFSGPASAYGVIYEGAKAYFDLANSRGGVGGRKVELIALDDAYQPTRVLSNAKQLVEMDKVFAMFQVGGTAHNIAAGEYLARQKVPHLYINTGASVLWRDRTRFPMTLIGLPSYDTEAVAFAQYIKQQRPNARIAVLYQNDPFGQDLLQPFERAAVREGLQVVAKEAYNVTEPSVDSQVSKLARSGADVFVSFTLPKFAAQAIRKSSEMDWKPLHLLTSVSASTDQVLAPAGLQASQGIVTIAYLRDPTLSGMATDPAVKEYLFAMNSSYPKSNANDLLRIRGYVGAQMIAKAIEGMKMPTRDALMQSALNMDAEISMLLPGIRVQTKPNDPLPIKAVYIQRFEGDHWVITGKPLSPKLD